MPSLDARLGKLESHPDVLAELERRRSHDPRWDALDESGRALVAGHAIRAALAEADRIEASGGRVTSDIWGPDPRLVQAALDAAGEVLTIIDRDGIEAARRLREIRETSERP